jgi:hypothetical protein
MTRYEIYYLQSDGGIDHIEPFRAEDDEAAAAHAVAAAHQHWKELWRGKRLIGRYPPPAQAEATG